jgi:hypothetical protein
MKNLMQLKFVIHVLAVEYLQAVMGSGTEYFGLEGSLQANTK